MASDQGSQIDLAAWARELEEERGRLEKASEQRAARRGYLVFATDPDRFPDEPGYREVFATEAKTPGEAAAKVRPLVEGATASNVPCHGHLQRRAGRRPLGGVGGRPRGRLLPRAVSSAGHVVPTEP
jgi:hypothetical protein